MAIWLVSGLAADYILRRVKLTDTLLGSDLIALLVASTVSQANLGHVLGDPSLARAWGAMDAVPPLEARRPITAYAVAAALGLPRETVRRKVKALIAAGYLWEGPEGVVVRPEYAGTLEMRRLIEAGGRLLAGFCADLAQAGLPDAAALMEEPVPPGPPRLRLVALAGTAFALRFFEDLRALAPDLHTGLTYVAVAQANMDHLDWRTDSAAFEHGMPPISLRRPVTALALAERLGFSRETARRQVRKLVAMGHVRPAVGGFVADPVNLPPEGVAGFMARTQASVRRLLASLRGCGVAALLHSPDAKGAPGLPGAPREGFSSA